MLFIPLSYKLFSYTLPPAFFFKKLKFCLVVAESLALVHSEVLLSRQRYPSICHLFKKTSASWLAHVTEQ